MSDAQQPARVAPEARDEPWLPRATDLLEPPRDQCAPMQLDVPKGRPLALGLLLYYSYIIALASPSFFPSYVRVLMFLVSPLIKILRAMVVKAGMINRTDLASMRQISYYQGATLQELSSCASVNAGVEDSRFLFFFGETACLEMFRRSVRIASLNNRG